LLGNETALSIEANAEFAVFPAMTFKEIGQGFYILLHTAIAFSERAAGTGPDL
jgi:hypothetical protein